MDDYRRNEDSEQHFSFKSISRVSIFGTLVCDKSQSKESGFKIKQRSESSHDLIPVNHTDGSWEGGAGSLGAGGRMTGHGSCCLHRWPVWWRVSGGLQVHQGCESRVGRVPWLMTNGNVVLVWM